MFQSNAARDFGLYLIRDGKIVASELPNLLVSYLFSDSIIGIHNMMILSNASFAEFIKYTHCVRDFDCSWIRAIGFSKQTVLNLGLAINVSLFEGEWSVTHLSHYVPHDFNLLRKEIWNYQHQVRPFGVLHKLRPLMWRNQYRWCNKKPPLMGLWMLQELRYFEPKLNMNCTLIRRPLKLRRLICFRLSKI